MRKLILLLSLFLLAGCSSAGPFVTNISSDGHNGLVIEKCDVKYNIFLGVISNGDCRTTNIKVKD